MNKQTYNSDFSQKILRTLDEKNMTPRPRWYFVLQEGGVWVLGFFATFCGAVAISATLFVFATAPFQFQEVTHNNVISFWLDFIPFLWIGLFAVFVLVTDYALTRTKRGYRYSLITITISSVTLSIVLGYVGFVIGLGEFLENNIGKSVPFYTPVHVTMIELWNQPEQGLLTGVVRGTSTFSLYVNDEVSYALDVSEISQAQRDFFFDGALVSVIGTSTKPHILSVCMVVPVGKKVVFTEYFENERNPEIERTNICKGVRPYERLQTKLLMNYEHE